MSTNVWVMLEFLLYANISMLPRQCLVFGEKGLRSGKPRGTSKLFCCLKVDKHLETSNGWK